MTKQNYTDSDIKVLSDVEHVRTRTNIYLGNTEPANMVVPDFIGGKFVTTTVNVVPAALKAFGEVLDNAVDEMVQCNSKIKKITIIGDPECGEYTISDTGRGVPIGIHSTGKHTPEVVFGSFRSGRNFNDDSRSVGVMGVNGVGSSATNACSVFFTVDVVRDGQHYNQMFTDGMSRVYPPTITKAKRGSSTGTTITFRLDPKVFPSVVIPNELLRSKAMGVAFNNPGVIVEYNGEVFDYKNGIDSIIKTMSNSYFKWETEDMVFYTIFDAVDTIDEQIYTWVNSSLLYDGGLCNTQFLNAFYDTFIDNTTKAAKAAKCEVNKNDIREHLLVLGMLKLANPSYDSQAKTRLTGPNLRKEVSELVSSQWMAFSKKNAAAINVIMERAILRSMKDSKRAAERDLKKASSKPVPGLIDATSKDRSKCSLYILEGLSAAAKIVEVRDPATMASYPLGGKVNNTYGCSVAELMKMGKIVPLIQAIGLIPGKRADRSQLKYGRVIIATDADTDGGDIFTTLVCLFYQFWPELFDPNQPPFIFRLLAPNVAATKRDKRVHFVTKKEFEANVHKYKGWNISYYKGLGSLIVEDWEMIIDNEKCLVPMIDDGKMEMVLALLFSKDVQARQDWLS